MVAEPVQLRLRFLQITIVILVASVCMSPIRAFRSATSFLHSRVPRPGFVHFSVGDVDDVSPTGHERAKPDATFSCKGSLQTFPSVVQLIATVQGNFYSSVAVVGATARCSRTVCFVERPGIRCSVADRNDFDGCSSFDWRVTDSCVAHGAIPLSGYHLNCVVNKSCAERGQCAEHSVVDLSDVDRAACSDAELTRCEEDNF